MKLICKKSDLLAGVNIVSKAVPSKTTMSILECILIDASEGVIKLIANDMELGIETKVEGEIIVAGRVAIDAKIFSEIVRKLPDNDVMIEVDNDFTANITCENAKFNILGKSGEDFAYLPEIEKNKSINLSQFALREVIRQTIFSIGDDRNNKILTGELFEVSGNNLKVVALDGHRIAMRNIELEDSYEDMSVIVPGKTLNEISKIVTGGTEDEMTIFFKDNHIMFEFDDTVVVSRLIEGEYYRVSQMVSKDYETKVTINKKEMLECLDRATLLIKEGNKRPIIITIGDSDMQFKMNSFIGTMDETIYIKKEGKDMMIGFDPKFLIDALKVIDDEEIDIYLVNPKAPCFIRDENENYIYLILPVNFTVANN
jgi:DNA polymerase-3 subunit beta